MDALCSTCLSYNRKLVPLSTVEVISSLFPFTQSPVLVCWECNSRLQNMQAFKAQATKAQELIKFFVKNKKPLKALRSLSRLSISSTKTEYDEHIVYCMKQEPVECEDEFLDDFESDVKYEIDVIEHRPKAEKMDIDLSESPGTFINNCNRDSPSKSVYIKVEPLTETGDSDGYDSDDDCPLSEVTKEKVCENESNIKKTQEPKNNNIKQNDGKSSNNEANLDKNKLLSVRQTEHKVEKFNCLSCEFFADNIKKLYYHVNKMHRQRPRCETCVRDFASVDSFKKHLEVIHGNGNKGAMREKCDVCGGMYRQLAFHMMRVHSPPAEDAFCDECGVKFKNYITLKRHQRNKHKRYKRGPQTEEPKGTRWLQCDECGHNFASRSGLAQHIASQHMNNYPFKCHICTKGFLRPNTLKAHVLEYHEGGQRPRDHVCSYCGRGFTEKQTLVTHIRTHTGERPFKCAHCPWSFTQRVALRSHERRKHPDADTGNTAGAGGAGNTDDGGKGGKNESVVINENTGHTGGGHTGGNTEDGGNAGKNTY